jgi:hypothetical protein
MTPLVKGCIFKAENSMRRLSGLLAIGVVLSLGVPAKADITFTFFENGGVGSYGTSAPSRPNIWVAGLIAFWEAFHHKEVSHEQEVRRSFVR